MARGRLCARSAVAIWATASPMARCPRASATASTALRSGTPRSVPAFSAPSPHPNACTRSAPALHPLCTRSAPALHPPASSICRHVPETAEPQLAAAAAEAFATSASATRPHSLPVEITQGCGPGLQPHGLQPLARGVASCVPRRPPPEPEKARAWERRSSSALASGAGDGGAWLPLRPRAPLLIALGPLLRGDEHPPLRSSAPCQRLRLTTLGHSPPCCPT